jgi:hypothetical protein
MKPPYKIAILTIVALGIGVIMGGTTVYYYIGGMCKDLVTDFGYTNSSYEVSKNIRVLYKLRESEIEKAINQVEQDLDTSVITLGSLLIDENDVTKRQEEKIIKQIEAFKKYREKYPKEYQYKEIESRITEIIKNTQ